MTLKTPLLLDLPMPITTKRLKIRPVMPGDGKQIFEAINESREILSQWHDWVPAVQSWEDSEATARQFYADFILRKEMHFAIFTEDRFVGVCGFHLFNWAIPSAAIGYWCRVSEQGKGYIREATAAITRYGFQHIELRRITILCDEANTKSAAIPEALGFTLEGTAKGLIPKPGTDELRLCRRYVRFNGEDLEKWEAKW